LVSRATGFILRSLIGFSRSGFKSGDLVAEDGCCLVIFFLECGLKEDAGLGQLGLTVGNRIVRAAAMVFEAGLDAGDGGQGLGGMCLVAGGAAEAVDTVEVGPAEAAGGAFASADRGGDG